MKHLLIVAVLATTLFSCNQGELQSLRQENQQLLNEAAEKDSAMVTFMESFNEIEQNLAEIRERELNIALKNDESGENSGGVQAQIKEDIRVINELISENKKTIEDLNQQLKSTKGRNVELNRMLVRLKDQLNTQIEEKDQQIALLKDDLQKMNFTVEELNSDLDTLRQVNSELALSNEEKEQMIEEQVSQINTAYIALGTDKELQETNIITKEGGFLGIGRTEKLSGNLDESSFTKIDIRETKTIPVEGKKIELVTPHPADSYKINGEDKIESIEITQPDKFWNNSKYLVVRVD